MPSRKLMLLVLIIVVVGAVGSACSGPAPTSTAAPPPTEAPQPPSASRCGDGICDEVERADPDLCPQDCPAAQAPPTQVPPLPTQAPPPPPAATPAVPPATTPATPGQPPDAPAGRCGDGVCDDLERADPNLCPQDCAATQPVAPALVSGEPDYEPPINIFMLLHLDPSGELGAPTFKAESSLYHRAYDEIQLLLGEAPRHGVKMTALFNGWYTKWAEEHNDVEQFRQLVNGGHEVGTHAHAMSYDASQDLWLQYGQEASRFGIPSYDAVRARQAWSDADRYMEAALAAAGVSGQNRTMCAWPLLCSDEGSMMEQFGFSYASGQRSEKGPFHFGHIVWNPWRPGSSDAVGEELIEDLGAGFIELDHYAQIGASEEAHASVDVTRGGVKKNLIMLYAEWLGRVRHGVEDRVWSFGFVHHPNYGDRYNADISDVLSWFDRYFVGKKTAEGYTIARYATVSEIGDEYLAWEQAHPNASSFHYVGRDPYPYTHQVIPTKLDGATYEAHVDLGVGVTCFRFSKAGKPIYLLWSDDGDQTVNLKELSRQVRVTDMTGQESHVDAATLALTEEPLFVER